MYAQALALEMYTYVYYIVQQYIQIVALSDTQLCLMPHSSLLLWYGSTVYKTIDIRVHTHSLSQYPTHDGIACERESVCRCLFSLHLSTHLFIVLYSYYMLW